MRNGFEKVFMGAAGSAGGAGLDVDEVFSNYLYKGTGTAANSTQTVTNGIDLDGEGGLVWIKDRATKNNYLFDTDRGGWNSWSTNSGDAEDTNQEDKLTAFNSDGFTLTGDNQVNENYSNPSGNYVSWTFRKAPKFFDVVTYTGNGATNRQIAHNLGCAVGMIIVKNLNGGNARVFHRSTWGDDGYDTFYLTSDADANQNNSAFSSGGSAPTSSVFYVDGTYSSGTNRNSHNYVAYLFAHNNGDGEFGPDSDQDIIKCGSYTGNGDPYYSNNPLNDLGFEPQWLFIKNATDTADWGIWDQGRPIEYLRPNSSGAAVVLDAFEYQPTGFINASANLIMNQVNDKYIYVAIRRGPLAIPESSEDVFEVIKAGSAASSDEAKTGAFLAPFRIDTAISGGISNTDKFNISNRIAGKKFTKTNATTGESANSQVSFDFQNGYWSGNLDNTYLGWLWRRAPSYHDTVRYLGNGTAGKTVLHSLGVAPEMIWVKKASTGSWKVFHTGLNAGSSPEDYYLVLNAEDAQADSNTMWNDYLPTDAHFKLGTSSDVNQSGITYLSYLFSTVPGVSKVGKVTLNNGASTNVDCGFSSGARWIMLKRSDGTGPWYVWDALRGIVSGNDPYLLLNSTQAEVTNTDYIDPLNAGFIVNDSLPNNNNPQYVFYAIAIA